MDRKQLIKDLAKKAGQLIKSSSPTQGIVQKDGRMNFATAADLASEKLIIETIKKHFPDDHILSEETHSQISDPKNIEHLWVIDPIDGTNNFSSQRNYSAVSIGYIEKGVIKLGCAYNPFVQDFYFAEKGNGAFLNDKKISVSQQTDLTKCSVGLDNWYDPKGLRKEIETFLKLDPLPWILIRGSAVLTICDVASNRLDIYFHMYLKPWDMAAALLILQEAGGTAIETNGNSATFLSNNIIAGNAVLVQKFLEEIKN